MHDHEETTALLLFGPQSVSIPATALLSKLRSELAEDTAGDLDGWVFTILAELPSFWYAIANEVAQFASTREQFSKHLEDLRRYVEEGVTPDLKPTVLDMPNMLLAPLVVLTQIVQYWRQFELYTKCNKSEQTPERMPQCLGFCIGMFSACAVASSSTRAELQENCAVAVRLAVVAGAAVDVHDLKHGHAISLATVCHTYKEDAELHRIISEFSGDAYKAVVYDKHRCTVTVSALAGPKLLGELTAAGIVTAEIGLRGRFHTALNQDVLDALLSVCDRDERRLQFSEPVKRGMRLHGNGGREALSRPLHSHALAMVLTQQADWYGSLTTIWSRLGPDTDVVTFGLEQCIPPSLMRRMNTRTAEIGSRGQVKPATLFSSTSLGDTTDLVRENAKANANSDDIAIVGLSIKVAGADDMDEFTDLLRSGKSTHVRVPRSRVPFESGPTHWRSGPEEHEWYGNFLNDIEAFDHRFFRRSPRESAAMDPQQRLLLQAAYQAVEMGAWCAADEEHRDAQVGVYVGVCATDYEHHVACHQAGAYSATGLLRGFIPGKVSHFFGWTGPSMSFDTACSGSAVAVHTACRAILNGECSAALCGGVNTIGNPTWFQNLAGASFLSPTGQCKPFDDLADGYCRGEGIACVFLKPMKTALQDGNRIFGSIASTAVYQNDNSTPLFVPNVPSLSRLFVDVMNKAQLEPDDIAYVEAHGTGTPVGDPAEYQSICQALGGSKRSKPLLIGSVKGSVGHTESASGIVSLIKVLSMMNGNFLPRQSSFSHLSRHIRQSPGDMIEIPTSPRVWNEERKSVLINNYGASGSNASMIVRHKSHNPKTTKALIHDCARQPFWIAGMSEYSIKAYCDKLARFTKRESANLSLADVSFNLACQTNRSLTNGLIFSCGSVSELVDTLSSGRIPSQKAKDRRPVILCFGGQTSASVGLDRRLFETVRILRKHVEECDSIIRSLGLETILPDIFSRAPCEDVVKLQTILFIVQYASAMCWIDSGLKVEAVVGHSFGEITALCVSGVLSLKDAIKLISGRAMVVKDSWGSDPGSMLAVEADLGLVKSLIAAANAKYSGQFYVEIACYNGPESFTLSGSSRAIEILNETLCTVKEFASIKAKKLKVTNAFHSTLVEPLQAMLDQVGQGLVFHKPAIRLERSLEKETSATALTPSFVFEHMRNPVYFYQAAQRLSRVYPSSIWLEAGSASTITMMANRALGSQPQIHFQSVDLAGDRATERLVDTTVALWNEGARVNFWAHHAVQAAEFKPLMLPPYQFEKSRHWLDYKPVDNTAFRGKQLLEHSSAPEKLWTFTGYLDNERRRCARFRVNTETELYRSLLAGHVAAQTAPICPATLAIDMAIEAFRSLHGTKDHRIPVVREVENHVALCVNPSRTVWLDLETSEASWWECKWKIISTPSIEADQSGELLYVEGRIELRSADDRIYRIEFPALERLARYKTCAEILKNAAAGGTTQVLEGADIYRAFDRVVEYGDYYQGVRYIVGREDECAGVVSTRTSSDTWFDVPTSDAFSQVAGLWVNCMTDTPEEDMFIATGVQLILRSSQPGRPDTYHVLARHHRQTDKLYMSDVFVFDAATGCLVDVMMGIQYSKVKSQSFSKILVKLTGDKSVLKDGSNTSGSTMPVMREVTRGQDDQIPYHRDVSQDLKAIVAHVCGIEVAEIHDDSEMAMLGIDSLMGMELTREVESFFKCKMDPLGVAEVFRFDDLAVCVSKAIHGANYQPAPKSDECSDDTQNWDGALFSDSFETASTSTINSPGEADLQTGHLGLYKDESTRDPDVASKGQGLPFSDILAAFEGVKWSTDQRLRDAGLEDTEAVIIARSNRLCVALIVEAFQQLGCSLDTATEGQILTRIPHAPQHGRLVDWLYDFLHKTARLIKLDDAGQIFRSHIPVPRRSSQELYQELVNAPDSWVLAHKLVYYAAKNLADVLRGTKDGLALLFGSPVGRDLVQGLYCDLPFNRIAYGQIKDVIGGLVARLSPFRGPLRILEMGAGTGGTTRLLVPFLAEQGIPVEYTFTDISPSMIARARKTFESYPFMRYAVHDIEKPVAPELKGQHIVLASNAIHATRNLHTSLANIRGSLRDDGFLMMTEMTEGLPFTDLVFGLLEGWWLFDDGRRHALVSETKWEAELLASGFGHVDWTDGTLDENHIQRVIIATASGHGTKKTEGVPAVENVPVVIRDDAAREAEAEAFVKKYTHGFRDSVVAPGINIVPDDAVSEDASINIVVTGATGSLGAFLVAGLAARDDVSIIICLNRRSGHMMPAARQLEAFTSRGINLPSEAWRKLKVFSTDISEARLGLSDDAYELIARHATHIIHNAWPMSGSRALGAFEPQFATMRNLIDLATSAALRRSSGRHVVTFQFVSSISVVGRYSGLDPSSPEVPEQGMPMSAVLPLGYCEAKWTCEQILEETLGRFPERFRAMVVRPGQIAGSRVSGYWNPIEHLPFLIKSSESLGALPALRGRLQWVAVEDVAGTMADLLLREGDVYAVYHIDNPVGQPWETMVRILAEELAISEIVPFAEWVRMVRRSPLAARTDNPAVQLIQFVSRDFEHMSCGGIVMGTARTREHSPTLATLGPIPDDVARKFVRAWKRSGFLHG
ncbi:putative polyketide synthase [Nemania serpens]|nr:putative polyketide synthase [Nemania serpens]